MPRKYLFTIEAEPYHPNRQLSIINSNGGVPRHHFSIDGNRGVLVAMIGFEEIYALQRACAWIKGIYRGYYEVRKEFEA